MLWAQKLLGRMGHYRDLENYHCNMKYFYKRSMCSKARHMRGYTRACVRRKRHITMGCDEIVLSDDAHVPIVPIHCWPKLEGDQGSPEGEYVG